MATSVRGRDPAVEEEFLGALYKGGELLASGKVVEAREHLEKANTLQPKNEKAQNLLGLTYFKLGLYEQASAVYERLVNENPADATLRVNLGLVYLKTNALERCVREFETATDLEPTHKKAHNYLGLALAQQGQYAKAKEHFELAGSDQMAEKMGRALAAQATAAPEVAPRTVVIAPAPSAPDTSSAPDAAEPPAPVAAPPIDEQPIEVMSDDETPPDAESPPEEMVVAAPATSAPRLESDWSRQVPAPPPSVPTVVVSDDMPVIEGTVDELPNEPLQEAPPPEAAPAWLTMEAGQAPAPVMQSEWVTESVADVPYSTPTPTPQAQLDAQAAPPEGEWSAPQPGAVTEESQAWSDTAQPVAAEQVATDAGWAQAAAEAAPLDAALPTQPDDDSWATGAAAQPEGQLSAEQVNQQAAGWDASVGQQAQAPSAEGWDAGAEPDAQPVATEGWGSSAEQQAQAPSAEGWDASAEPQAQPVATEGWASTAEQQAQAPSAEGWDAGAEQQAQPVATEGWDTTATTEAQAEVVVPDESGWSSGATPAAAAPPTQPDDDSWATAGAQAAPVEAAAVEVTPAGAEPPSATDPRWSADAPPMDLAARPDDESWAVGPPVAAIAPERVEAATPPPAPSAPLPITVEEPVSAASLAPRAPAGYAPMSPQRLGDLGASGAWVHEPGAGPFHVGPDGLAVTVAGEMLMRMEGLVAVVGGLEVKPEHRRRRGRPTGEPFGQGAAQLQRVAGNGMVYLEPGKARFHAVDLTDQNGIAVDDDGAYLREELVFAFEEPISFENGRVSGEGQSIDLAHLKGTGRVLLQLDGSLRAMPIPLGAPLVVPLPRLVGWFGRVTPRLMGFGGRGAMELTGEGYALLGSPPERA